MINTRALSAIEAVEQSIWAAAREDGTLSFENRNARIWELRKQGMKLWRLGKIFDLSVDRCRQVCGREEARERRTNIAEAKKRHIDEVYNREISLNRVKGFPDDLYGVWIG